MAGVALQSAYGLIGFSAEATLVVTNTHGIDSMEEIKILTDKEIDNLCKVMRRPGGINPITNVSNLGFQVSLRAENNLKLASFFIKYETRTGRVAVTNDIILDRVRLLREFKYIEK